MATRPIVDKNAEPVPPTADRLLLAEELLDLAERALGHTRATGCAIALKLGEKLFVRTSIGVAPEVGASLPIGEGAIGECARAGRPCNLSEEQIDATLRGLGVRSLIAVPIHHAGIFYGVLVILSQSPEAFTRMHVAIMMTMGNEVARVLKRMEPIAVEIAPGAPLRSSTAPIAAMEDKGIDIPMAAATKEQIVEAPKKIEQKPAVASPMKLIIDPPRPSKPQPVAAPKPAPLQSLTPAQPAASTPIQPATPAVVTSTTTAKTIAALSSVVTDSTPPAQPLPELLCPGEDPREYGTLKSAKSLEPKPTFTAAPAYRPEGGSRIKAPAIAAAVVILLAAGYGIWHHGKAPAVAHEAQAPAAEAPAATAAAVVTTASVAVDPPKVAVPASTPTTVPAKAAPEKKTAETKVEVTNTQPAPEPKQPEHPALLIPTAVRHSDAAPAEPPSLVLANAAKMPDLGTPKVPAASLLVKRTTATPPAVLHQVAPVYPDIARRAGTSGDVRLQVTVSETGKVSNVRVIDGYPVLRQAASSAVAQWLYRPATLDGRPVESTVDVVVKFAPR